MYALQAFLDFQKMKLKGKIFYQFILLSIFTIHASCQLPYASDIKYLDIDSVYKTDVEKKQFQELKSKFLQVWMDSNNCYVEKPPCNNCPIMVEWKYPRKVYVENILHSTNFDTILVLVTWYSAQYNNDGSIFEERTKAIGMGAVIDSLNNFHFKCNGGTYWLEGSNKGGNQCSELAIHLKRLIIKGDYFKKDRSPDPTFWKRLYTDKNIWKNETK